MLIAGDNLKCELIFWTCVIQLDIKVTK